MIEFNEKNGYVDFVDTDFINGKVVINGKPMNCDSSMLSWKKNGKSYIASAYDCKFKVVTINGRLSVQVKNTGKQEIFIDNIAISFHPESMKRPLKARDYLEYIHSPNMAFSSGVKKVGLENRWQEHNPESSIAYLLDHIKDNASILFSIDPQHKGDIISFRALHDASHLEGNFGLLITSILKRSLSPGETAETTPVTFTTGKDPLVLLEKLGDKFRRFSGRALKPVKVGWNSWDYYAGAVTDEHIYLNQKAAKKHFKDTVKYFVIDEGWEPRWGVWKANWKFPEGLKTFCRKIRKNGSIPGVWTSPMLVNTYTNTFRDHPDWFGRDNNGNIVQNLYSYGPMAYLDITHPEVINFICQVFSNLKQAGFDYFKVDFTQEVLRCDTFNDPGVPRGNIIRTIFRTIRDTIGDESYLLACGAPYESVTGIVDAVRAAPDIHNYWGHVIKAAGEISARWWMHRKCWNNDPDFLIVRAPETSPDPMRNREYTAKPFQYRSSWLQGRELNLNEARTYALLIYMSAGDIFLGDNLNTLNKTGIDIIKQVLKKPLTRAAVPLDLFVGHESLPAIWYAEEKDFSVIAIFNWEEDSNEFSVDIKGLSSKRFKSVTPFDNCREKIKTENGMIKIRLEPRESKAFILN